MRGIRFEIPNEWGSYLKLMFNRIPIGGYSWKVFDSQVYIDKTKAFLKNGIYTGEQFESLIRKEDYYIVYFGLFAYLDKNKIVNIKNHDDFLESSCDICMLIYDSSLVNIYIKRKELLSIFLTNAKNQNFEKIEYITAQNDWIKDFHAG